MMRQFMMLAMVMYNQGACICMKQRERRPRGDSLLPPAVPYLRDSIRGCLRIQAQVGPGLRWFHGVLNKLVEVIYCSEHSALHRT